MDSPAFILFYNNSDKHVHEFSHESSVIVYYAQKYIN